MKPHPLIILAIFVIMITFLLQIVKPQTSSAEKLAQKISGSAITYAKNQCQGPCPVPNEKMSNQATAAIRIFTNSPKLELVRMSGINRKNQVFYCATENQCWTYDVKLQQVTSYMKGE